jgi:hypothetical protein
MYSALFGVRDSRPGWISGCPRPQYPVSRSDCPYRDHRKIWGLRPQYVSLGHKYIGLHKPLEAVVGWAKSKALVPNGHAVPAIETLEKMARALEIQMYKLFYDGEEPPKLPNLPTRKTADDILWGSKGKDARQLAQFCWLFSRMEAGDLGMVLFMAQKMARRKVV